MVFENIFEKKIIKKKEREEKIVIIADYREKNSLVLSELVNLDVDVSLEHLDVGDYLIKDVIIERKTITDFISSMINKRLFNQLINLKKYNQRLLIIEGKNNESYNSLIHPNALRGIILSTSLDYSTPIIMTKDCEDTAKYLSILAHKKEKVRHTLRESRNTMNDNERLLYLLEGFEGIGPVKATLLLKKFGNIKNIICASEKELFPILKKKTHDFLTIIHNTYSSL